MNYRCPKCRQGLAVRSLFFRDISACAHCGQKVVLGDFVAFAMATLTVLVTGLAALVMLSAEMQDLVAACYALSIGVLAGLVVLFLLGRAMPYRGLRRRARARAQPASLA